MIWHHYSKEKKWKHMLIWRQGETQEVEIRISDFVCYISTKEHMLISPKRIERKVKTKLVTSSFGVTSNFLVDRPWVLLSQLYAVNELRDVHLYQTKFCIGEEAMVWHQNTRATIQTKRRSHWQKLIWWPRGRQKAKERSSSRKMCVP